MGLQHVWQSVVARLRREHRGVKSFEREAGQVGGVASGLDRGIKTVPTEQIVGSVSRWQNLRSDFFYRTGQAMTRRFHRVGQAMSAGTSLPPLELYKLKRAPATPEGSAPSEYYVVDGHHRVAMARKLGQDFLDAHVIEFRGPNDATGGGQVAPDDHVTREA